MHTEVFARFGRKKGRAENIMIIIIPNRCPYTHVFVL